jgi:hypothetical protein
MNGCGALFTGLVLLVVVFSKFSSGAWLVVLLIPALVWLLSSIQSRYNVLETALGLESVTCAAECAQTGESHTDLQPGDPGQGPILICLDTLNRAAVATVRQACSMSREVKVLFVYAGHHDPETIQRDWDRLLGQTMGVTLTLKESPYASFVEPLVSTVREIESLEPDRRLTVMMPEVISQGWLDGLLLNQSINVVSEALREGGSRLFSRYRYYLPV